METRSRELACLAVIAVFDVPFIRYAHERIGVKVGLSLDQVSSAIEKNTPEDLTDIEVVVYKLALKLARARGPLDKESWQEAERELGREGAARIGYVVAWFVYKCTLLNLGAIDVPSVQDSTAATGPLVLRDRGVNVSVLGTRLLVCLDVLSTFAWLVRNYHTTTWSVLFSSFKRTFISTYPS